MPHSSLLAYVEHSAPGASARERCELIAGHGLEVELAHRLRGFDAAEILDQGFPITTLQAYAMHEHHPLHPDPERHRTGLDHVKETIALAARFDVPRVLTVCGFGHDVCADPFARCLEFFHEVAPLASAAGIRIVIELLTERRAGAMASPMELVSLLDELDAPDVFGLALDTGHIADGGHAPAGFLSALDWTPEVLQLRGRKSRPPTLSLASEVRGALKHPPAVISVEHRTPISREDFDGLVRALRELWPDDEPA